MKQKILERNIIANKTTPNKRDYAKISKSSFLRVKERFEHYRKSHLQCRLERYGFRDF